MSTVIDLFERHGYVLELLACVAATTWKLERQERFAARLTGIKVWLVLLFVYGMSGLLSGLGGVMSASRLYSANGNLGVGYELDAIAAVILGGTSFVGGIGTITGTLVGALIIATLNNGMTLMGVSYFWQLVIKGAVIIIAVLIDKYRTRHHQSA